MERDDRGSELRAAVEAALASLRQSLDAEPERRALLDALEQRVHAEIGGLRAELTAKETLLRGASAALMRDAAEVVRVVAALEKRDAAIRSDLQLALRFQRAMLGPLPTAAGAKIEAVHLAAETISGDVYDVASVAPDTLRVFVADATGHGVAAGLATMFIKSEYEVQKRHGDTPGAVLEAMNDLLASRYSRLQLRFTALCGDLHVRERRFVYASAAHPGPLLVRANGSTSLPTGGTFVGLVPAMRYADEEATLEAGDALVVFTDGFLDASDRTGARFGDARARETLEGVWQTGAPFAPAIVRALSAFVGEGRALEDDATVVAIRLDDS